MSALYRRRVGGLVAPLRSPSHPFAPLRTPSHPFAPPRTPSHLLAGRPLTSFPIPQIARNAGQYVSLYTGSMANLPYYEKMGFQISSTHEAPGACAWWFKNSPHGPPS